MVHSKIFSLYHFLGHIINSLSHIFSSPTAISLKYSPILYYNYKILFSIPTFYQLLIFLLLIIRSGPTSTVFRVQSHARLKKGEREADLHVGARLEGSAAAIFGSCSHHTEGRGWAGMGCGMRCGQSEELLVVFIRLTATLPPRQPPPLACRL
jgi:hypothetical protein